MPMKASELAAILNSTAGNRTVIFDIKESGSDREPDTNYGIDQIIITDSFITLRSVR